MRDQHDMFGPPSESGTQGIADPAKQARDQAIEQVEATATTTGDGWMKLAESVVTELAKSGRKFTTDDVWDRIPNWPLERRAIGATMAALARQGTIEFTGDYQPSRRRACHGRPIKVWVGLI